MYIVIQKAGQKSGVLKKKYFFLRRHTFSGKTRLDV
jgi:hypothetical protein